MVYVVTESLQHTGRLIYIVVNHCTAKSPHSTLTGSAQTTRRYPPIMKSTLAYCGLVEYCADAPHSAKHVPGYFAIPLEGSNAAQTGFGFGLGDGFFANLQSTWHCYSSAQALIPRCRQNRARAALWLRLCFVIGWLWVPTFSSRELRSAFIHANRKSAKRAAKRQKWQANKPARKGKGSKKPIGGYHRRSRKRGRERGRIISPGAYQTLRG